MQGKLRYREDVAQGIEAAPQAFIRMLLAAARAVLENRAFADAAQAVLEACRTILGAEADLVAVCVDDGASFEVAVLEPGGLALDPAAGLPAPLRRLIARVSRGRSVHANDLAKRRATSRPVGSGASLQSALVAPMIISDGVARFLGLLDKPGGFSTPDSKRAEVFAEMAAVAMLESRTRNGLERNRRALEKEVREGGAQLQKAEQRALAIAETLREATMALTRSLDRETVLVTLLDWLRRIVPFDRAAVMLFEEAKTVSVRAVFDGDRFLPVTTEGGGTFDPPIIPSSTPS